MKIKYMKYLISAFVICSVFISCSNVNNFHEEKSSNKAEVIGENSSPATDVTEAYETGTTTVRFFVPDYYTMAEQNGSRAIAPQTTYVRLSVYNSNTESWNLMQQLNFADAEKTAVQNAPSGFPGSVFTLIFDKVYAKSYGVGELKLSLLNSSGSVITSGTNATAVVVSNTASATTTFYTIPETYTNSSSGLAVGEMKFVRYTMKANTHYTLHLDVEGSAYPDVVVFNESGMLESYYAVDNAEASRIEFNESSNTVKYIGVWADDNVTISSYKLNLYTDLTDFSFKDSSIGFWAGENYAVKLTPIPADSYLGKVTYTSSNENILVSEDGVISGTAESDGVITVSYAGISHTIAVNVYERATELQGVLSGDKLHWTKDHSPYKVTGNVTIEENTTLVVDPGVKVYFTGNHYIKMNGTINAVGSKTEPIIITKAASYSGTWDGLKVSGGSLTTANTYQYISGNILEYVDFSYVDTPLTLNKPAYVDHCNFTDCNKTAAVASKSVLINNYFESGVNCSTSNSSIIINNVINKIFNVSYTVKAINNTFNNTTIRLANNISYITNLTNNIFNACEWNILYAVSRYHINNNNFINYSGPVLSISTSYDSYKTVDFTDNYWGETQTAELIANEATGEKNVSFINDYFDDSEHTKIDYTSWKREPIEGAGYKGDAFIAFDYTVNGYDWDNGGYYPEVQETALSIVISPEYNVNDISYYRIAQGYDNLLTANWQPYTATVTFDADKTALEEGFAPIYIQLKDSEGNVSSPLCHNVPFDSPVISTSLVDDATYANTSSSLGFDFSATDGGCIRKYEVLLDGFKVLSSENNWGTSKTFISQSESSYKIGIPYMASGNHVITFKVWDIAGNLTTEDIHFTITGGNAASDYENVTFNAVTGQPIKDSNTLYLWHLDEDGSEAGGESENAITYTHNSSLNGLGGCASWVYTNDNIAIDVSENKEYTVEFWAKGTRNIHVEKSSTFGCNVTSSSSSGTMVRGCNNWTYIQSSDSATDNYLYTTSILASDWHYWAFTYKGTSAAIYCDGVLLGYVDEANYNLNNSDSKLYIGGSEGGNYDEIRISKIARSADEIKAYYDCAKEKIE